MSTPVQKIGIREFRSHLPSYLFATTPVEITRHGETVGYYIPTHRHPAAAEVDALKQAALQLEQLLHSKGVTEEELVADFRKLREENK